MTSVFSQYFLIKNEPISFSEEQKVNLMLKKKVYKHNYHTQIYFIISSTSH